MKLTFRSKLIAGLLVGTLDIIAACVHYFIKTGKGAEMVLQYIASGVFGEAAFIGGDIMIAWGLLLHYIIAVSFAFLFFAVYPLLQQRIKSKMLIAVLYGIFMWVITECVIVPLSNTPKQALTLSKAVIDIVVLTICIGLPLVLIAGTYTLKKEDD